VASFLSPYNWDSAARLAHMDMDGAAANAIGVHECQMFFRRGLGHLILCGVFERFPDLKFVMTETNSAWAPQDLFVLDMECKMAKEPGNGVYPYFNEIVRNMSLTPSTRLALRLTSPTSRRTRSGR
jgi:hypothetical protein